MIEGTGRGYYYKGSKVITNLQYPLILFAMYLNYQTAEVALWPENRFHGNTNIIYLLYHYSLFTTFSLNFYKHKAHEEVNGLFYRQDIVGTFISKPILRFCVLQ